MMEWRKNCSISPTGAPGESTDKRPPVPRMSSAAWPSRSCNSLENTLPIAASAIGKVFASELQERIGQAALDILGTGGLLSEDSPGAPVGEMEQLLRHSIMGMIGGGTSEIQRNIIAQRGLDLPR